MQYFLIAFFGFWLIWIIWYMSGGPLRDTKDPFIKITPTGVESSNKIDLPNLEN